MKNDKKNETMDNNYISPTFAKNGLILFLGILICFVLRFLYPENIDFKLTLFVFGIADIVYLTLLSVKILIHKRKA